MSKRQYTDADIGESTAIKQLCSGLYSTDDRDYRIGTADSPRLDVLPKELLVKILHQCRSFRQRLRLGSVCRKLRHCLKDVYVWKDVYSVGILCKRTESSLMVTLSVNDQDGTQLAEVTIHTDQLKMAFKCLFDVGRPQILRLKISLETDDSQLKRLILDEIIIAMPHNSPLSIEKLVFDNEESGWGVDTFPNFVHLLLLFVNSLKYLMFDFSVRDVPTLSRAISACTLLETLVVGSCCTSDARDPSEPTQLAEGIVSLPRLESVSCNPMCLTKLDVCDVLIGEVLARSSSVRHVCFAEGNTLALDAVSVFETASSESRSRIESVCCVSLDVFVGDEASLATIVKLLPNLRRLSIVDILDEQELPWLYSMCQAFLELHQEDDAVKHLEATVCIDHRDELLKRERLGNASVCLWEKEKSPCFVDRPCL